MQFINIIGASICAFLLADNNDFLIILTSIWIIQKMGNRKFICTKLHIIFNYIYFFKFIIKYDSNKKSVGHSVLKIFNEINRAFQFLIAKKHILIYGICSQIVFAFLIVELFTLLPLFVKNCLNENIVTFPLLM